jgi:formylglycine-generating enzyme required for sulfatase activity
MRLYLSLTSLFLFMQAVMAQEKIAITIDINETPKISINLMNMPDISRIKADQLKGKWDFYIQKYETSCKDFLIWSKEHNEQLDINAELDGSNAEYECELSPQQPVTTVSWVTAKQYCNDKQGRLPTEIEWVVAASINTGVPHVCYKDKNLGDWVNSTDILLNNRDVFLACVYQKKDPLLFEEMELSSLERQKNNVFDTIPGINGVYGMQGNVWEWTETQWQPPDITDINKDYRVIKGGAFSNGQQVFLNNPQWRNAIPASSESYSNVGFRCAWDSREKN